MKSRLTCIFVPLLSAVLLVSACSDEPSVPFRVDTQSGSYLYTCLDGITGPAHMQVNGINPLTGSYRFVKQSKMVLIRSIGELDIIMEFSGDSVLGSMEIKLKNAGEKNLEVWQLNPFVLSDTLLLPRLRISQERIEWDGPGNNGTGSLEFNRDNPWNLGFVIEEGMLVLSLYLGDSPLVLLPREEVMAPVLQFRPGSAED